MTPRLLVYEDGIIKVTAEAYGIPEVKALIDKYDMNVEPYLAYVHGMSAPDSPYINTPEEERQDVALFDVQDTHGQFDFEDPLVDKAIARIKKLYQSPLSLMADEIGEELNRFRMILKTERLTSGGEGNFKERMAYMEKIDKISMTYRKVRDEADKEIVARLKGTAEMGEY